MVKGVDVGTNWLSRVAVGLVMALTTAASACSDGGSSNASADAEAATDGGSGGNGGSMGAIPGQGDGGGGDSGAVVGPDGTPLPPSEDFLFASDFSSKRATDVPPWKRILFQHPGVRVRGWTRSAKTAATTQGAGKFDFQALTPVAAATLEDAIATERYAAVSFEPNVPGLGFDLNGATVTFAVDRKVSDGAGDIVVLTSVGGFTADKAVYVGTAGASESSAIALHTFTLPDTGYDNLSGNVELRFYAVGIAGSNATTAIRAFWVGGKVINQAVLRTPKRRDIGTNLSAVAEYGTDSPFLDKFKMAQAWYTSKVNDETKGWEEDLRALLPLDAEGWPKQVPFTVAGHEDPRFVHALLRLPYNGKWVLMYKGTGTIKVLGSGSGAVNKTIAATGGEGRLDFVVNKSDIGYGGDPDLKTAGPQMLYIEIRESSAADPIKDIRVVHNAHLATYENEVFEPAFIARLHGFSPIRFIEWTHTNVNTESDWGDRITTSFFRQSGKAVAYEYMIKLLNVTKADGWIAIPHLATDDYIKQLATLFRDTLDPSLKLYVEFSNETWNKSFPQGEWVVAQAKQKGMDREAFAARQQVRVWEIFKTVYGDQFESRIRRPIGGFGANMEVNRGRLQALTTDAVNPQRIKAQGLALAPYFGKFYSIDNLATTPTVEKLLEDARLHLEEKTTNFALFNKLASEYGVELWANEGGQSIRPDGHLAREEKEFIANIIAANRSDKMAELYTRYFQILAEGKFTLFMHFTFVGPWSKFGAWGGLEALDQPLSKSPKHRVLEEIIFGK